MPLFEFLCETCGKNSEILVMGETDTPKCSHCGSVSLKKQLSAPSSMSGSSGGTMPGPGDTACCGSSPGEAAGCAGPGSCCGRSF